jgi:hypothetical protein
MADQIMRNADNSELEGVGTPSKEVLALTFI